MMVVGLLLAQLVLPGPPSGPIQPPGMICLGECAGPVVWGPAERGRLVVACDMRSDTCSDGRKITTTRATPVPCETSPGAWEMVGVDEGCYSVRGLESWASTTSYLSYGAELDRSPWASLRGGTIEALPDGYRITNDPAQTSPSGIIQGLGSLPAEGAVTLSCIVRTQDPIARLTLEAGTGVNRHWDNFDTKGQWEIISVSGTVAAGASRWASIAPRGPDLASVDVQACWYTHTSTPGRPCWGGEAPVTCAADRHTISTEGWPTEAGEVCVGFGFDHTSSANRFLLDTRSGGEGVSLHLSGGAIIGRTYHMGSTVTVTGPTVPIGSHIACLQWDSAMVRLGFDGQHVGESSHTPPSSHRATATITYDTGGGNNLNGSISFLRVRSFE